MVELPSKGLVYPIESPLSKGLVEIKYMTTKEEDILSTESYIKTGVVVDKLLQSLIVDPTVVRMYDSLVIGDRNAIFVAARAYGYSEIYDFETTTPSGNKQNVQVNLFDLKTKELADETIFKNENKFYFKLPHGGQTVTFKLLTIGDDKTITERLKKTKSHVGRDPQLTERLCRMILEIDGNSDPNFIRLSVEQMLAKDSRAFREYVAQIQPNIDMEVEVVDEATGEPFRCPVTIGTSFLWPNV
jgi:hypothetical protein